MNLNKALKMLFNIKVVVVFFLICLLFMIPAKKPINKERLAVWRLECDLGIISDPECPVDGGWSPWSPWSPCQGPCDNMGHRRQTRDCINPPPSQDGAPCSGPYERTDVCFISNCTVNDYRKLVTGDSSRTEAFRQLEVVPALLERCLQMTCPYEAVEAALAYDNTWQLTAESLWNALLCVKHNIGCPVIGEWSVWGEWSACGARCGLGLKWRLRRCDNPPPSHSHLNCKGSPLEANECVGDQCSVNSSDAMGSWGPWSSWSLCSAFCGTGVRHRRRVCLETNGPQHTGIWGTRCQGQYDELQLCENGVCYLDGEWSGWGRWGPCSQTCGSGKRSRSRSCTRPVPAGGGMNCTGPRVEIGACHLKPCKTFKHTVATFHGESHLYYNFQMKRAALYQCYIRFLPLSPHGSLVRRETGQNSYVRLSLQKWHLCLDACDAGRLCCLPRFCSHHELEPETWHNVLVTVTNDGGLLRIDDSEDDLKVPWPCTSELTDDDMQLFVGEKFHGKIQEIIINFIPLDIVVARNHKSWKRGFTPTSVSNVAYEISDEEEAYLSLSNDQYLRIPCFNSQSEWQIQITFKPKRATGTILFLMDDDDENWLHLALQNTRLQLKLVLDKFISESSSTIEYLPDQWLDVTLSKKQDTNAIEASINAGERLFVLFEDEKVRRHKELPTTVLKNATSTSMTLPFAVCTDELFVSGVSKTAKNYIGEDFTPFIGIVALISIDGVLLDLHQCIMEHYYDDNIQVSSRTASVSGSYHEVAWGKSNNLNLTCLHARTTRSPHTAATWLYLHTMVSSTLQGKRLRSVDDGRVLRLVANANNDLRGFYTCRAHRQRRTLNIVTYGVIGRIRYKLSGPDTVTIIAVITTLTLVIGTLFWLVIECIHDIRNGYGFFRDAQLTPKEEAEAVCAYIDQNMDLIGSKSAAKLAKCNAWKRAKHLACPASFGAQEPQGMEEVYPEHSEMTSSEPDGLPALPEAKTTDEQDYDVLRFEPCYISSPRHGTITSPNTEITLSSSFELVSPKTLCSRLLMSKGLCSSRASTVSLKRKRGPTVIAKKPYLATIKSSRYVAQSPAHKILQRFHQLKRDD